MALDDVYKERGFKMIRTLNGNPVYAIQTGTIKPDPLSALFGAQAQPTFDYVEVRLWPRTNLLGKAANIAQLYAARGGMHPHAFNTMVERAMAGHPSDFAQLREWTEQALYSQSRGRLTSVQRAFLTEMDKLNPNITQIRPTRSR